MATKRKLLCGCCTPLPIPLRNTDSPPPPRGPWGLVSFILLWILLSSAVERSRRLPRLVDRSKQLWLDGSLVFVLLQCSILGPPLGAQQTLPYPSGSRFSAKSRLFLPFAFRAWKRMFAFCFLLREMGTSFPPPGSVGTAARKSRWNSAPLYEKRLTTLPERVAVVQGGNYLPRSGELSMGEGVVSVSSGWVGCDNFC